MMIKNTQVPHATSNRRKKNKTGLTAVFIAFACSISGCTTIVSTLHSGPIKQEPGEVPLGTSINNNSLEVITQVNIAKSSKELNNSNISVIVYDGSALLVGQVPTESARAQAGSIAAEVKGINTVMNKLEVTPDTSYLTRSSDSWLTMKVKMKMLATSDFSTERIKVVTENSVVYLMGTVKQAEADKAVNIARSCDGVQKIVKAFNYLD